MGDIWQEHRRFILAVVIGGLVFLIAYLVIDGIFTAEITANQQSIRRSKLAQQQSLPSGVRLSDVVREREGLEKAYEELERLESRVIEPAFENAQQGDPDLHYNAVLATLREEEVERCAYRNIQVDANLGQPERFPTTRGRMAHYLRGYDVVRQVLNMALLADQGMEGGIARIERINISKPIDLRRGQSRGQTFVQDLTVEMTIVGHPRALDLMLRPLATAPADGRFLAVKEATIRSLDLPPGEVRRGRAGADPLDKDRVEVRLKLNALVIDREGRLESVKAKRG